MNPAAPASNRRWIWIAAAVFLILVVAVAMRLGHHGSEAPQPTASRVAPENHVTDAPASAPATVASAPAGIDAPKSSTSPSTSGSVAHEAMPEVTNQARKTINGTVKVSVRVAVDTHGKVSRAALASAGPSKYFANQALQAAREWTFVAPVHDGKPQTSAWTLLFEFKKTGTKTTARRTPAA